MLTQWLWRRWSVIVTVLLIIIAIGGTIPLLYNTLWHLPVGSRQIVQWFMPKDIQVATANLAFGIKNNQLIIEVDKLKLVQLQTKTTLPRLTADIAQLKLQTQWWPLVFKGKVQLTDLLIKNSQFDLYQNHDGSWLNSSDDSTQLSWQNLVANLINTQLTVDHSMVVFHGLSGQQRWQLFTTSVDNHWRLNVQQSQQTSAAAWLEPTVSTANRQLKLQLFLNEFSQLSNFLFSHNGWYWQSEGQLKTTFAIDAQNQLNAIESRLVAENTLIKHQTNVTELQLSQLEITSKLQRRANQWVGIIEPINVVYQQQKLPLPTQLTFSQQNSLWQLHLPTLPIHALQAFQIFIPGSTKLQTLIKNLQPRGILSNGVLTYQDKPIIPLAQRIRFTATGHDLYINTFEEIPALGPLEGNLETNLIEGHAQVYNKQNTTFALPSVFQNSWQLSQLSGQLKWHIGNERQQLWIDQLTFHRPSGSGQGQLYLDLHDRAVDQFYLQLKLNQIDLTPQNAWLPLNKLPEDLRDWLAQNIHKGAIREGDLRLHLQYGKTGPAGSLDQHIDFDDKKYPSSLMAHFQVADAEIGYLPDWPVARQVNGEITLRNDEMSAQIAEAKVLGLTAQQAKLTLINNQIALSTPVHGSAYALQQFLLQAPLNNPDFNAQLKHWSIDHGDLMGQLTVQAPLRDKQQTQVNITAHLQGGQTELLPVKLQFANAQADSDFWWRGDDQWHFNGDWQAKVFNQQAQGKFAFNQQQGQMQFRGQAAAPTLQQWLKIPAPLPLLSGITSFTGKLKFTASQSNQLQIYSDLNNLQIDLPAPFGKSAKEAAPFSFRYDLTHNRGQVSLANRLLVKWQQSAKQQQGEIWLQQWPTITRWPQKPGWQVNWPEVDLNYAAWQQWLKRWSKQISAGLPVTNFWQDIDKNHQGPPRQIRLHIGCWRLKQQCLAPLDAAIQWGQKQNISIEVNSDWLTGNADYQPDLAQPVKIHLQKLQLDPFWQLFVGKDENSNNPLYGNVFLLNKPAKKLASWPTMLTHWPNGMLQIDQLMLNQLSGQLSLHWHLLPKSASLSIDQLTLLKNQLKGEIFWQQAGEASVSFGDLTLQLANVADLLKFINQPAVIVSKSGEANIQFNYPGAPWQANWLSTTGKLALTLNDGQLTTIDSPSARLIGLLNFDNLLRRMQLNFSDLTDKGLSFKKITGQSILQNGILTNQSPIKIDAVATQFTLTGEVDLINRTLNQHLAVTLPLSEGLPIAALVAGAPQLSLFLLFAHWAFGSFLDQFTELHYLIKGPWSEPQFNIERMN